MKNMLLIIITASSFIGQSEAAQKIKFCGSSAKNEVKEALVFVQRNLNTIMSNVGGMTSKEKKKLRKKAFKVNIKCMDHKKVCKKRSDVLGVSRHLFNSAVVLCYNSIRDYKGNNSFCALTDTIIHEFGHTANVEKDSDHNDRPNNDKVYRLGYAAESLCNSFGINGPIPKNTNN